MSGSALLAAGCALAAALSGCGGSQHQRGASTGAQTEVSVSGGRTPKYASPASSAPVRTGVVQLEYRELTIDPDAVRAKVGSTIRWVNGDPQPCNVVSRGGSYRFASGQLAEGKSFQLRLTRPGTIHYECTAYPATMNGTIQAVR
jgi:plastocyanin